MQNSKSSNLSHFTQKFKNHNINFQKPKTKITGGDFTDKIKNISKMIDFMARERSKTRRSNRKNTRSAVR